MMGGYNVMMMKVNKKRDENAGDEDTFFMVWFFLVLVGWVPGHFNVFIFGYVDWTKGTNKLGGEGAYF